MVIFHGELLNHQMVDSQSARSLVYWWHMATYGDILASGLLILPANRCEQHTGEVWVAIHPMAAYGPNAVTKHFMGFWSVPWCRRCRPCHQIQKFDGENMWKLWFPEDFHFIPLIPRLSSCFDCCHGTTWHATAQEPGCSVEADGSSEGIDRKLTVQEKVQWSHLHDCRRSDVTEK